MTVRNPRRCRRNCPEEAPKPGIAPARPAQSLSVTSKSEGDRIWRHALYGTGTCIGMIEGYAQMGMPGDPLDTINEFVRRLVSVAAHIKAKRNESTDAQSGQLPAREDHSQGSELVERDAPGSDAQGMRHPAPNRDGRERRGSDRDVLQRSGTDGGRLRSAESTSRETETGPKESRAETGTKGGSKGRSKAGSKVSAGEE